MAEDIDDLLEEVESKYLTKDKKKARSVNNRKEKRDNDYDIDDLLDDLQVDPIPKASRSVPSVPNSISDFRPASGRKCFPVYLGGSMCSQGIASSVGQRTCDKLRCTSCDFKVCSFDNYEWNRDTDYLFLRNNVPDYHRLKTNMVPKKGSRAYCCQCSHRSIVDITKLADPQLKWVCGKH